MTAEPTHPPLVEGAFFQTDLRNIVRVGDIEVASQGSVNDISALVISLLKDPAIKDYLEIRKKQRSVGGMFG